MTAWPALWSGATLFFSIFGLSRYFGAVLAAPAAAVVLLAVVAAIAVGVGRAALRAGGFSELEGPERTLIGATLGLGALSLGLFFLAAARLLRPWAISALLAFFFVCGYAEVRAAALDALQRLRGVRITVKAAAAAALLALIFWACWVPPHQYDTLVYHLALPQAYLRAGGFAAKELLFSHFPQNAEMLFTLALSWRCDILAQMLMWLATALSAWWTFEAGKRELGTAAAALACLLLVSQTAVMLLASTTYVEPLVMLWVTAAALSFFRGRAAAAPRRWLALSGIFCGLALGAKYYAGIAAGLIGFFLVFRWATARDRRRGQDAALFIATAAAVFSPWLIKNALTIGNPVFPFLYGWFPMTGTGWSAQTAEGYFKVFVEYGHGGGYWHDLVRLPGLLLSNSLRYGGGMDVLGDLGWDLLFWCLPLSVWAARGQAFLRGVLAFCLGYLAVWFFTGVVLRFLVVLAPLLCLLAAAGLCRVWAELGAAARAALAGGVGILTAAHVLLFLYVHGVFGSERFLLGLEGRADFLSRRLSYYPCATYAREHLQRNDKILIVGEQRGYYVEQDHIATTVHAPNRFVAWANEAQDPRGLAAALGRQGISHLLVVPSEAARLALGGFTEKGERNWSGLEPQYAAVAYEGPACALLALGREAAR